MNAIFLILPLLVAAPHATAPDKLHVVTTLTDLRSIAQAIGGDLVEASSLCAGKQDPHFVDPKPTFLVRLREADLFLLNGLDLEIGWVPPLLEGARNANILRHGPGYFDASKGIPVLEIPAAGTTRAEGDVHPFGNPHYLLDPLNGLEVARAFAEKLKELRPESAAAIDSRLQTFTTKLQESLFGAELLKQVGGEKLERLARQGELTSFLASTSVEGKPLTSSLSGWLGKMQSLRGQPVVTFHKSMSYLETRFGFHVTGFVEPKPGIPPSPSYIAELVDSMKKNGVKLILTHPFYDEQVPRHLAEKTGARVVMLPSAVEGMTEAKDYFALFDTIVARLLEQKP